MYLRGRGEKGGERKKGWWRKMEREREGGRGKVRGEKKKKWRFLMK